MSWNVKEMFFLIMPNGRDAKWLFWQVTTMPNAIILKGFISNGVEPSKAFLSNHNYLDNTPLYSTNSIVESALVWLAVY